MCRGQKKAGCSLIGPLVQLRFFVFEDEVGSVTGSNFSTVVEFTYARPKEDEMKCSKERVRVKVESIRGREWLSVRTSLRSSSAASLKSVGAKKIVRAVMTWSIQSNRRVRVVFVW
jgi:hypothetical protein